MVAYVNKIYGLERYGKQSKISRTCGTPYSGGVSTRVIVGIGYFRYSLLMER